MHTLNKSLLFLSIITLPHLAAAQGDSTGTGPATHQEIPLEETGPTAAPPPDTDTTTSREIERHRIQLERERVRLERERIRAERVLKKQEARARGRSLIRAGAISLGAGYGVSVLIGSILLSAEADYAGLMFIPIIGSPLVGGLYLADADDEGANISNEDEGLFMLLFSLPAISQAVGTALLTAGLIRRHRYNKSHENQIAIVPVVTRKSGGLSLTMRF